MDAAALEDLRWYLEDYLVAPFGVYEDRGRKIAAQLREWGEALFGAVFGQESARDAYRRLVDADAGVQVIVRSDSPVYLGWPWELLQDPKRATPVALGAAGMCRSLQEEGMPAAFGVSGDRLRVLMVIARPRGSRDVGYRMVARPLLKRLKAVRGRVELVVLRPPTVQALVDALQQARAEGRPFQVVHFDGHGVLVGPRAGIVERSGEVVGGGEGFLVFEPSDDGAGRVSAAVFASALKEAEVPLVVLNACQSGAMSDRVEAVVATRLLQEGIAGVVAMGYSVYATAAAEFVAVFYEHLFAGEAVTEAVAAGRRRLFQQSGRPSPVGELPLSDWLVPVHYLRNEIRFPDLVSRPPDSTEVRSAAGDHGQSSISRWDEDDLAGIGEFVGRDASFYELERMIRERRVVVVHGAGGSGKTELAKAFGRWWKETGGVEQPDWVILQSFESGGPTSGLDAAVASAGLRLLGPTFGRLDAEERRRVLVEALRTRRVLLIWDSFESVRAMSSASTSDSEGDDIKAFLAEVAAPGGVGAVMLTSRSTETWLGDVGRLGLLGLANGAQAEFIDQLIGSDAASQARRCDPAFCELLAWLDGHPLSMRIVLPHLATTDPAMLLDGLRGDEALPTAPPGQESRTTSLAACVAYSFDHVGTRDRSLVVVVCLLHDVVDVDVLSAFSATEGVPERFHGITGEEWFETLERLAGVGLLTPIGAGMFKIHPALPAFLCALWRRESPLHDEERARSREALLDAYAQLGRWLLDEIQTGNASLAFDVMDRQDRTLKLFLAHAVATQRWGAARLLVQPLNEFWRTRGLSEEPRSWVARIRCAVETPDGTPPQLESDAGSLWLFIVGSHAYRALLEGDLDAAEQIYTEAREMLEAAPDHPLQQSHLAVALHQLGLVAQERGRLDEAKNLYNRSLALKERIEDRSGQAGSLHHLGVVAHLKGEFEEAEDLYRRSLLLAKGVGDRPSESRSYHQLGTVAESQGRFDEAEDWYVRSLAISEELGDAPGSANTFHHLGRISEWRRRWDEAEAWHRRALTTWEVLDHRPGLHSTYHHLGRVAQEQGRWDEAEDWYHRSLSISVELSDELGQATSYGQLGRLAEESGNLEGALRLTIRSVAILQEFPDGLGGPGPSQLARLTRLLGTAELQRLWEQETGQRLPPYVQEYVQAKDD